MIKYVWVYLEFWNKITHYFRVLKAVNSKKIRKTCIYKLYFINLAAKIC